MRIAISLICLCSLLAFATTAAANEVLVHIQTIHASAGEPFVDPDIESLQNELRSGFPGYQVFHLLGRHELKAPQQSQRSLKLPDNDNSELVITYLGRTPDPKLLRLEIGLRGKLAAEVKASPGSTFFQAGLTYKDGILILAIKATLALSSP